MAEFAYRSLPETWHRYTQTGATELTKPRVGEGSVSSGRREVQPAPSLRLMNIHRRVALRAAARVAEVRVLPAATLKHRIAERVAVQVLPLPSAARPAELRNLSRHLATLPAPALCAYLVALELWQAEPRVPFAVLFGLACDGCGLILDQEESACLHA